MILGYTGGIAFGDGGGGENARERRFVGYAPTCSRGDAAPQLRRMLRILLCRLLVVQRAANRIVRRYSGRRGSDAPKQLVEERLRRIVDLGRRLLMEVRVRPDVPAHAIAQDLQRLIELADLDGSAE